MRLVIVGAAFMAAVGVLIWLGVVEGKIPNLKIQDLKSREYSGQVCRIDDVLIRSIERPGAPLEFTIHSEKDQTMTLAVHSKRNPPDNFKVGNKVMVKGVFDPKANRFEADEIQTACPSRYEASKSAEVAAPGGAPQPEKR